jgi:hypothetical protein
VASAELDGRQLSRVVISSGAAAGTVKCVFQTRTIAVNIELSTTTLRRACLGDGLLFLGDLQETDHDLLHFAR